MVKDEEPIVEQLLREEAKLEERDKGVAVAEEDARRDDDTDDSSLDSVYSYSTYASRCHYYRY